MTAIRFALLAIRRSPIRSLLVVALLGVGLSFAVTSIGLANASDNKLDEIRGTVGTTAVVSVNPAQRQIAIQEEAQKAEEEGRDVDFFGIQEQLRDLTEADLLQLEGVSYATLLDVVATTGASFVGDDVTASEEEGTGNQGPGGFGGAGGGGFGIQLGGGGANFDSDVQLQGGIDPSSSGAFASGTNIIVEGSGFTPSDVEDGAHYVVVDQETAALNGYALGDVVELETTQRVLPSENDIDGATAIGLAIADAAPETGQTEFTFVTGPFPVNLFAGMTLFAEIDGEEYPVTLVNADLDAGTLVLEANDIPWAESTVLRNTRGETHSVSLEIIGIYASTSSTADTGFLQQLPPTWYVPLNVVRELQPEEQQEVLSSATFDYGSADNADQFADDVAERLDPDAFLVTTTASEFEDIETSVGRLSTVSRIGLVAGLSVVGVIMVLLMALIVRSRVREIGILKAIGAPNRNIVGQFGIETLMLSVGAAVVALGLSLATGSTIADQFKSAAATTSGSEPTATDTGTAQPQQFGFGGAGGFPGGGRGAPGAFGQLGGLATATDGATSEEVDAALDSIDFSLSPNVLGLAFGAAFLVALAGVSVPTLSVVRMRPADVLRFES